MKQKLAALRTIGQRRLVVAATATTLAAPAAFAEGTNVDVGTVLAGVLPNIINSLISGMSTTISAVAPIIALALGIAYAVKLVRNQVK